MTKWGIKPHFEEIMKYTFKLKTTIMEIMNLVYGLLTNRVEF